MSDGLAPWEPSSPRPSSPSLPPVRREKRERFVEETLVGKRFKSFFIPLLSRWLGGRLGEKGVGGYEGRPRRGRGDHGESDQVGLAGRLDDRMHAGRLPVLLLRH